MQIESKTMFPPTVLIGVMFKKVNLMIKKIRWDPEKNIFLGKYFQPQMF